MDFINLTQPDLSNGTRPIADIFWYCGWKITRQTLPPGWGGCCTTVLLSGKLTVLYDTETTWTGQGTKCGLERFDKDNGIYVDWRGVPVGVPNEHVAMLSRIRGIYILFAMGTHWEKLEVDMWYNQWTFWTLWTTQYRHLTWFKNNCMQHLQWLYRTGLSWTL